MPVPPSVVSVAGTSDAYRSHPTSVVARVDDVDSRHHRLATFEHVFETGWSDHDRSPRLPPRVAPRVDELQARIRGMQATRLDSKAVPTHPALRVGAAGRHAPRGHGRARSRARRRCSWHCSPGRSASGRWVAVAGMPEFGVEAAARFGIALERLVLVPDPGRQWLTVVAALADVIPVVAVRPAGRVAPAEASRLSARLRQRGTTLLVAGDWPGSDARLGVEASEWHGLERGHGHLGDREVVVSVGRPRRVRPPRPLAAAAARPLARVRGDRPAAAVRPPVPARRPGLTEPGLTEPWRSTSSGGPPDDRRPRPHDRALVPRLARSSPPAARPALDPDAPIALTEAGLVFACSAAARRDGVARGLKLREAQYRSPGAHGARLRRRARRARLRTRRAARSRQTVPGVQLVRPGTLAMRARGPARYYGGEDAAARALLDTMAELGVPGARVGVADGPFAAEQAARAARASRPWASSRPGHPPPSSRPLPVALVVDPRTTTLLNRLGVRTLGEFAALPEADVRRRFGAAGAFAHDRAAGREQTRVHRPHPAARVRGACSTSSRRSTASTSSPSRSACVPSEFIERMRAVRLVCTGIRVELDDERGGHSSRSWLHPRWFTPADVVDRVRWQLQGAGTADTGLASPIVRLRVMPERIDSTGNHEEGLWGGGPDERVHHGLTRVQSMLGHEAVVTAADRRRPHARRPAGARAVGRPGARAHGAVDAPWPGSLPGARARERVPRAAADRLARRRAARPSRSTRAGRSRHRPSGSRSAAAIAAPGARVGRARGRSSSAGGTPSTPSACTGSRSSTTTGARGCSCATTTAGGPRRGTTDGLEQPRDPVVGARAQALRPAAAGRAEAHRRRRRQPRMESQAASVPPVGGARGADRPGRALRRAARALDVQLPRRRLHARAARRGGAPARPLAGSRSPTTTASTASCASPRRPRASPTCRPSSAPSSRSGSAGRRTASPTPRASTCSCSPGARRATTGSPSAITAGQLAGGEKGRPVYSLEALAEQSGGEWIVPTGCRKGAVRRALAARRAGCRGARARPPGRALRPRQRRRRALRPRASARPAGQRRARRARRAAPACRCSPRTPCTTRRPPSTGWHRHSPRCARGAASTSSTGGCPPPTGCTCAAAPRWPRRFARYPGAVARSVTLADELALHAAQRPPEAAEAGGARGAHAHELAARARVGGAERAATRACPRPCASDSPASSTSSSRRTSPATSSSCTTSCARRAAGASCARVAARPRTRRSATCCASPRSTRSSTTCRSSGSSRRCATKSPTSTSTSTPTGARRSSSTSTTSTAAQNAAQVANVISYRPKAAVRDMAKALGYSTGQQDAWSRQVERWGAVVETDDHDIPDAGRRARRAGAHLPAAPRHPLGRHGAHRSAGGRGRADRARPHGATARWCSGTKTTAHGWAS